MILDIYQVDAFSDKAFAGNPAAVVLLTGELSDAQMLAIAAENNLSETAFIGPTETAADYQLRWFTPKVEVDLCGHATLAAAYVLFEPLQWSKPSIRFSTLSGMVEVARQDDKLALNFPARPGQPGAVPAELLKALGLSYDRLDHFAESRDYLVVLSNQAQLQALAPDFQALAACTQAGVIVTAPGDKHDFVSRFFVPSYGIDEDPVTGSAHCTLVPYWAGRLHKTSLLAKQISPRGGELYCQYQAGRVIMAGYSSLFLKGEIYL